MNRIGKLFFLVILVSMAFITHSKAASRSGDQLEANAVVNNYFNALTQGDTNAIKSLLGGDLFEKRKRLLDNPTYPEHLINTYSNARLELTNNVSGNDSITVDAAITLNSGETMNRQYLLKKDPSHGQYIIYSESTPEDMGL